MRATTVVASMALSREVLMACVRSSAAVLSAAVL